MRTETRTTIAILLMAVLGVACGIYLGIRYRPRPRGTQIARQPSVAGQPPPPAVPAVPAQGPAPTRALHPPPAPSTTRAKAPVPTAVPSTAKAAKSRAAPRRIAQGMRPGKSKAAVPVRSSAAKLRPTMEMAGRRAPQKHLPTARVVSVPATLVPRLEGLSGPETILPARRHARATGGKPLRSVATMSPVRALPEPRRVRQQRVARAMAVSRQRAAQMAARPRRRVATLHRERSRPSSIPSLEPALALGPRIRPVTRVAGARSALSSVGPLSSAARARLLARAAQRVRYIEQAVVLEGQPATLATYVVWDNGKPRTFSFVRQDRRTDQARIVRVNEDARQVTALVVARGAVVQAVVPAEAVVTYGQALITDPPSSELLARADALLGPGPVAGPPPMASRPPVERVAGMRELVGQVRRVDPAARLVTLAGPEGKTPFRVPEGTELPKVGEVITITVPMDGQVSPQPMTMYTPLQATVAGVVIHVRPTAVELTVQTLTPEGRVVEVPVPVTDNARVFISGQPGDLRALKEGFYIRAYMTPNGETRILGVPSAQ